MLVNISLINGFIDNIRYYPVSVLFGGVENPTPKQKKHEKRIVDICEELYYFCSKDDSVNLLSALHASYHDLKVCINLINKDSPVNVDYLLHCSKEFLKTLKPVCKALTNMHKQDPLLKEYYQKFSLSFSEMSDILFNTCLDYTIYVDLDRDISLFQYKDDVNLAEFKQYVSGKLK